jgi:hypothetical protein
MGSLAKQGVAADARAKKDGQAPGKPKTGEGLRPPGAGSYLQHSDGWRAGLRGRLANSGVVLHSTADGPFRHLERTGGGTVAGAVGEQLTELPGVGDDTRPSQAFALSACSPQPSVCPLHDLGARLYA